MNKKLNYWATVIGIIAALTGIIWGAWGLYYAKRQVDDLDRNRLQKEYEQVVLMIEQGKTCKNQLATRAAKSEHVPLRDRYECFRVDSISCALLEKFIVTHDTPETLSAIDYYIAYYDNKKNTQAKYKDLYQAEIAKLQERRASVLQVITKKNTNN